MPDDHTEHDTDGPETFERAHRAATLVIALAALKPRDVDAMIGVANGLMPHNSEGRAALISNLQRLQEGVSLRGGVQEL